MSHSMVPMNIVSALVKAEQFLGGDRRWYGMNADQLQFLDACYAHKDALSKFSDKELHTWVDTVASRLNAILKENGFSIELKDFEPGGFGVVSILDVMVEWLKEGQKIVIRTEDNVEYPAVRMENYADINAKRTALYSGYTSDSHAMPVAQLPTKSGDTLCMTIANKEASGFELMSRIDAIRTSTLKLSAFSRLVFPMVDFEEKKSLDWLLGLKSMPARGDPHEVAQALQETKFKMNQFGARLKDAVAIGMRMTSAVVRPVPPLVIDKPFYLWIERPGVPVPVMYAYFDENDWKDPGDLKNM